MDDSPDEPGAVDASAAGTARVAADAAAVAPSDLTIRPAWTADMPARPQPQEQERRGRAEADRIAQAVELESEIAGRLG